MKNAVLRPRHHNLISGIPGNRMITTCRFRW